MTGVQTCALPISAWENLDRKNREELKRTFREDPLFKTYLQALGFTLAKIELPVWEFYLARSGLSASDVSYFREVFRNELKNTWAFFREVTGEKNPVWFRPWLGKSIELRAALIHPLNLLQILAQEDQDLPLLRICATGIASGMLTTG